MTYDYFIAGRYRNKENVLELTKNIRAKGKSVYCFVESATSLEHVGSVESDGEVMAQQFEQLPDWWNNPKVQEIFNVDMQALRDS
jgi:hypothetical protein